MTTQVDDPSLEIPSREKIILMLTVVKRSGALVPFRKDRILNALEWAFRDTKLISQEKVLPPEIFKIIVKIADGVVEEAMELSSKGVSLTVEGIQDLVEMKLMQAGCHDVARDYIIYRDKHKALREDSSRHLKVLRSDGLTYARFNPMKIASSLEQGFLETHFQGDGVQEINQLTTQIVDSALKIVQAGGLLTTELIQDEIERLLMENRFFAVAKYFILERALQKGALEEKLSPEMKESPKLSGRTFTIYDKSGISYEINEEALLQKVRFACMGYEKIASAEEIVEGAILQFYAQITKQEVDQALIFSARSKIEIDPVYAFVAARLLLNTLYEESIGISFDQKNLKEYHAKAFKTYLEKAVSYKRLTPALLEFDVEKLAAALDLERDHQFTYLGLQTLYDRYFIHEQGVRLETPQYFWMRVAMGLSLKEGEQKNERAIEFYNLLSSFAFVSSTPTLFNAGTLHSQLSSCYLSTIKDDLHHIFKVIADDAQLSKWAGGIGNDWTSVRSTGSIIRGTNGSSQGVIPFLKVANDTAVAVNQGGKRKGAMCAYLETWHLDVEDFLELRKNTGDERRRTHDMNTANWIPDLFMKRVKENKEWTLFSPADTIDLHDLYGEAFEERYVHYEEKAKKGEIKNYKTVEAMALWRKMLSMLFETGHPWITFKDPSNIRSPQDHQGVVHSSNLCTEILLNTSESETAVCNLGSINLAFHCTKEGLDEKRLAKTVETAVRMLDNVIDINFYPIKEAENSNLRHRPIGLGLMGFQDALYIQKISYASHEAVLFADSSMEMISYYAILASAKLASERGAYPSYKGSKWDRGLLPIDTLSLVEKSRGGDFDVDRTSRMDWSVVRAEIARHGMRNSNTMAIAPTATISNITGVTQSIEPMYKHLFVKSNLSGEFTVPNPYLVEALKEENLWDLEMIDDLKYYDGSILEIDRIPASIKQLFVTAFEIEPEWLIECASRRQKWIDMGQSLNLYLADPSGKKLHNMYMLAWQKGLKTTYYLRSLGATQIEKSTTDINKRGMQPRWMKSKSASSNIVVDRAVQGQSCNLGEACESCQ